MRAQPNELFVASENKRTDGRPIPVSDGAFCPISQRLRFFAWPVNPGQLLFGFSVVALHFSVGAALVRPSRDCRSVKGNHALESEASHCDLSVFLQTSMA